MEVASAPRTILPLALTSGIHLYLTVLVVRLSVRNGWVADAPPGLHVLEIDYSDGSRAGAVWFAFMADRAPLAEQFASRLSRTALTSVSAPAIGGNTRI
jgi:hypothetical protein